MVFDYFPLKKSVIESAISHIEIRVATDRNRLLNLDQHRDEEGGNSDFYPEIHFRGVRSRQEPSNK